MTNTVWRLLGCWKRQDGTWVFDQGLADSDVAAAKEIHQRQIEKYGVDIVGDMPDLLTLPVIASYIAERDGERVDFAYMEANVEVCMGGCDARAAAALRQFSQAMIAVAKKNKFRMARVFVPRVAAGPVGKELKRTGFKLQDEMYAHWLLDLRGGKR